MAGRPDTIFALSSGRPPAGIGVIRISGPRAGAALQAVFGKMPHPRRAEYGAFRSVDEKPLDRGLAIWFPGPETATGEDLAELHCHGGRAVVNAIERRLASIYGLREAEPGEFTRRALENGRIDLAEAEGLADLLAAETEMQRAMALSMAGGALSRQAEAWREEVLRLSALVEGALDFSDEDDVADEPAGLRDGLVALQNELDEWLSRPRAEMLGEGFTVVLAGPPNSGKSTLFNALVESEAAITSPIAGTTRDVVTRSVALDGVPFRFVDTAGLRDIADADAIEAIGIGRAQDEVGRADLVLWLGEESEGPEGAWEIDAQIDREGHIAKRDSVAAVSAVTGVGLTELRKAIIECATQHLPKPGEAALNARQAAALADVSSGVSSALMVSDLLLVGEGLRTARAGFDRLVGRTGTEDMFDALFGRFCVGK